MLSPDAQFLFFILLWTGGSRHLSLYRFSPSCLLPPLTQIINPLPPPSTSFPCSPPNTQKTVTLSPDGLSYYSLFALPSSEFTFGNCGCNTIPDELGAYCAWILYDGRLVKFYNGQDCNGTVLLKYDGFADEVYTCGYKMGHSITVTPCSLANPVQYVPYESVRCIA